MVEVLKTGLYDTIQDLGRLASQEFGVPISGVMDRYSAALANSILGNPSNAAVIESVVMGPHLKFKSNTVICVSGAEMNVTLNAKRLKNNVMYSVNTGDVLKFNKLSNGCRSYLAVFGGFQTEVQMGSRSMYKDVTRNYILNTGDVISILDRSETKIVSKRRKSKLFSSIKSDQSHFEASEIEVFRGPEFENLDSRQQNKLFNTAFLISKDSNRMAYQFDQNIENSLKGMITSVVLPGTVQLTPSGKLIVLMRDCQITGGYPRILQLTENAVNKLAQKISGSNITFKSII
jgi:biotin-dependent carboxylase-like uncharacterized protein